jgi:putative ABC transport system permease protein
VVSLGRRNLFHDKVRLIVTITGVVFAIVLIAVQLGLFIGFAKTTSGVIDHSGADFWIASRGVPFLENGVPFSERKLYQALAQRGVADVQKVVIRLVNWKRLDGTEQAILIVGFDVNAGYGGPWNIVSGEVRALKTPDSVFIDELYREKLGIDRAGDSAEINGRRARVVGFTRGIRSFTTSPYVFTSFKNAQDYAEIPEDKTTYLLVRAEPGADAEAVRRNLERALRDVDVYTTAEFSRKTQIYWMFTTGAGIALLIAALLGVIVGVVVVSQTIYATTMDHIREYGTLKAIGASNRYIYRVLVHQAAITAAIGFVQGIVISYLVVYGSRNSGVAILLPTELAIGLCVLTFIMCISASIVSIRRVIQIDPAIVFK